MAARPSRRLVSPSNQDFVANNVPEVLAARASSRIGTGAAQARLAEADAKRYASLIESGDVSRSAYDKAKTAAETAAGPDECRPASIRSDAECGSSEFIKASQRRKLRYRASSAQVALARKAIAGRGNKGPLRRLRQRPPMWPSASTSPPAQSIATILRITPVKLQLQVPQMYAPNVRNGAATWRQPYLAFADRTFTGRVTAINPAVETTSRTFIVEAAFPKYKDLALKPGMFAPPALSWAAIPAVCLCLANRS